jgi:hypothetical protein
MIHKKGTAMQYLLDYKSGKIKNGLGINTELDDYLRFKPSQLVIILGHDNVGKSYWINWYFLTLALTYQMKFIVWSGENNHGQILRDMVQMYSGVPFKELTEQQIQSYSMYIEQYFDFVDNSKLYKPKELLEIFAESDAVAGLIDPYTALDRDMTHEGNYKFLNEARLFANKTGMTIYINTHPNSESGRSGNLYTDGDWKGHLRPPLKASIEGGKPFLNRCDDMIVIHRLVKHEAMKYYTMIDVEKVKDTDTGGKNTSLNNPILCEFNYGLGFVIGGKDALAGVRPKKPTVAFEPIKKINFEPNDWYEPKAKDDDCPF